MAAITTIGEVCDFILDWTGLTHELGGQAISSEHAHPACVDALNERLGKLWSTDDRSHVLHGLFNAQDEIIDPARYQTGADGIVRAVRENQGVWSYGFRPNESALFVTGDWAEGLKSDFDIEWRPINASFEDALIWVLLANFCIAFRTEGDFDPYSPKPDDADILLWMNPKWDGLYAFEGFWTNKDGTMLHYGGMGCTARQQP